jgi:polyhydroxybutyrate depolymerase
MRGRPPVLIAAAAVAAVSLVAAALVLRPGATPPDTLPSAQVPGAPVAPATPWKWPRPSPLPPVSDVTGLPGDRLVAAKPVPIPGANADGTGRLSVQVDGRERIYLLAPARRVAPRSQPALVMVLPAANTNLRTEYDRYGLDALRDHGATVVVMGTYAANWNAGSCCGRPVQDGINDVNAVTAVRNDALRRAGADPGRVALLGHSVGAFMAWRLACTPLFGAAAVVAVSGTLVHPCPSSMSRTPRMLALNGAEDRTVPVDGSRSVVPILGIAPPSVRESAARVAAAGGCSPARRTSVPGGTATIYDGCSGGGSVRLVVVDGQGHPWADLDAGRRASAFLAEALTGVR